MVFEKTLIIFIAVAFIHYSECGLVRRFNYDARLFEHFALDSRFIQYSRTEPDDWKNITVLAESRNFTFTSMICTLGPGAWIFYPDSDYQMGNQQTYYLVVGEHCVRADDIDSIQPLGKMDELLEQGVLLFEQTQFASPQTLVTAGEGEGQGGSLIFTGGQSFVIEGGSEKICLRPGLTIFEDGYCLIPNLKASFNMEGTIKVKENCTEDDSNSDEKKLVIQNCYMEGVHEIYSDQDLTIDKLTEVCGGGGSVFLKNKFTIVMDMWSKRLGDSWESKPNFTNNARNDLKMGLLWNVLEIFKETCSNVDDTYIYLLGHLYAYHMKYLWSSKNYTESDTTPEEWNTASEYFKMCYSNHSQIPIYSGSCKATDEFNRLAENALRGFTEEENSWYEIVNGDNFDPVIEQMWLIFNYVLPRCSMWQGYINNDWSDLVLLFHQNFLDPLALIWTDPGDWVRVYNAAFHGYDMREVHKDIIACLRAALEASPDFDPIGRPEAFRAVMSKGFYKHQIPDEGKIDAPPTSRPKRG